MFDRTEGEQARYYTASGVFPHASTAEDKRNNLAAVASNWQRHKIGKLSDAAVEVLWECVWNCQRTYKVDSRRLFCADCEPLAKAADRVEDELPAAVLAAIGRNR